MNKKQLAAITAMPLLFFANSAPAVAAELPAETENNRISPESAQKAADGDFTSHAIVDTNKTDFAAPSGAQEAEKSEPETAVLGAAENKNQQNGVEIEFEYLSSSNFHFKDRHINTYNTHIYTRGKTIHALTLYYGLTLSRALGYTSEDGIYRDSQAFGIGPSIMLRWEKHFKGKLYGDWDASGSALIYDHDHPAEGRGYGFLWRTGPRLTYAFDNKNSFTLGYTFAHYSNGMRKNNPGYNGAGLTVGYQYKF